MDYFETGTGFSIELSDWRLEARGTYKGLPLYESLGGIVTAIAIVETPAIGKGAVANDKERIMAGPVMIPDIKMFRSVGPNGHERCYWYFSKETITELQGTFKGKIKMGH
ncbi:MAG: hypothetical protein ACSHXL_06910 [Bacteroidota bacterium]